MNKLSKKQAEWLISKFEKYYRDNIRNNMWPCDVKDVISQCTEKEFPELYMRPKHGDDEEQIKIYQSDCVNGDANCIVLFSYEEYTHFNKGQFKQFAEGVNKIVKWLDEQEE